jgi:hypothetical protein
MKVVKVENVALLDIFSEKQAGQEKLYSALYSIDLHGIFINKIPIFIPTL